MFVLPAYYDVNYHIYENYDIVDMPIVRRKKKYKLIADYVIPLYQEPIVETIQQVPIEMEPITIINYFEDPPILALPSLPPLQQRLPQKVEVLSDKIEFVGDKSNYARIPYLYSNYHDPPIKRVTRIIRYVEKKKK